MMKDPLQPERCAELLGALAAPERLKIVQILREGPHNVGEIAQLLKTSVVNASHHLSVLRHARLVRHEKQGRYMLYSLPPGILRDDKGEQQCLNLGCCKLELPDKEP
jgi:DNA-binding transcriptional ArsR family regulator